MSHPVAVRVVIALPSGIEISCDLGQAVATDSTVCQANIGQLLVAAGEEMLSLAT